MLHTNDTQLEHQFNMHVHQERLTEDVQTLNLVNFQIAELQSIKEKLEARIASQLAHEEEGSKTYTIGKFKVVVRTGWIYSIDKEEYQILESRIPEVFNPVKKRVSFDIDKSIVREAEKYASPEELLLLSQFLTKKPSKLSISVKAAI